MASVWKRLQRVNKRAAKFQYTASYHRIDLETSPKWKPNKLSVVWTRRSRREITEPLEWEPSLKDPLKGSVVFSAPQNHTVTVTLFKDSRTNELEDKDWTFVLEDVSVTGKRRRLASAPVNMRKFASLEPSARPTSVPLEPSTHKVTRAAVHLTLHCVLLREGHATDEDMQSLASLLSVNNNSDIAVLEDLDEDDTYTLSDHSTRQMLDLRQQMEEMTHSLTNSDIAATPNSVQSLSFDNCRTPTAHSPGTPATPTPQDRHMSFKDDKMENTPKFDPKKFELKSSTPIDKIDNFKEFKPRTIAKMNLKPLELKTNLNSIALDRNDNEKEEDVDKTPTADMERLFPGKFDKDKTPVSELLEWCQAVTREHRACRVTNLTTSFRSGLAFCAIIHHFRPDLIDFSGLQPEESERNVRCALEASAALGISQVLTVADVCARPTPDRLAIMTYLFQLRAHFTGSELQVEQLGNDETESSYLVGRHDTDGSLSRDLFSREISMRRSRNTYDRPRPVSLEGPPAPPAPRPAAARPRTPEGGALRGMLTRVLPHDRNKPTAKWFAPAPAQQPIPARPEKLMTRKELTDPFGSDEEDEEKNPPPAVNGTEPVKVESKPPIIEPAITDPLTLLQPEPTHNQPVASSRQPTDPLQPIESQPVDKIIEDIKQPVERQPSDPQPIDNKTQPIDNQQPKSPSPELPKPTPQLLSRHDELKERARQLLEATKREAREKDRIKRQNSKEKEEKENGLRNGELSPKKPMTEEERQVVLRERARKLIADARAGIVSPTSPLSPSRTVRPTLEIISRNSVMEELAAAGGMEQLDALLARECSTPTSRKSLSPDRSDGRNSEDSKSVKSIGSAEERRSPLHSFSALVDRLTPDKDNEDEKPETGSYIQSELEALEKEQRAIDERAAALEKQLRTVMEGADNTEEEAHLMSQWFNLVNKKNALLRRQMQLNILEQEEDLSRRCELLARELRLSLGVDEWRKTPGQKRRERLLLQELLSAVNERDRLVQEMDEQEKAIADDDEIERNLSQVEIQRKNNCILQ